jgi:hypothetical protein
MSGYVLRVAGCVFRVYFDRSQIVLVLVVVLVIEIGNFAINYSIFFRGRGRERGRVEKFRTIRAEPNSIGYVFG